MKLLRSRRLGLAIVALVGLGARGARAERLFVGVADAPSGDRRIARVRTLDLDRSALASLREKTETTLVDFPLGADGPASMTLRRFAPFTDDVRVEIVEAGGVRTLALPDQLYYRGAVKGDAASRVLLIAGRDYVRGFVATGGTIYRFGEDDTGVYRSWALRDADAAAFPAPPTVCANDAFKGLVEGHPGRTASAGAPANDAPPALGYTPTLMAEVAIDTDEEFLNLFADIGDALSYVADLAAAVSAIYDADVDVRTVFRYVRLWSAGDPWSATSTNGMLGQLRSYWLSNEAATPRDTVHFLSGKGVVGGIAYLDVLCDPSYGYGVSTVYGAFDLMDPYDTWDVMVVAHELGHNFGSEHTHCYDPPLDHCYAGESGCYSGAESVPPGGGTIMSYCHLHSGGLSNVNMTFGPTVSGVLRAGAENGACIGLPCGDGYLDDGEECDDGNITNGDCCSAACMAEPDGGSCDDGESCTGSDECNAGACAGTPVTNGTPCDDGSVCTADACQAGSCVGVAAPATGCKVPTLPQKSQLLLKDRTPDTGDQVSWKWTRGQATTLPELGNPAATDAYRLCVYDASPSVVFSGTYPAGGTCVGAACWKTVVGKGFTYRDRERSPNGMEKLSLVSGDAGKAKVTTKGKGVNLVMPALGSLPLPVVVQLRGPSACWEATFSTAIFNNSLQFKAKSD